MVRRMGIILDLPVKNRKENTCLEKYQNILEICSLLIKLYLSENPTSQITLLLLKNRMMGQLTHFSGDIKHHNQGLWHLIFGNKKIDNLDLGFFFSERINLVNFESMIYDLYFISQGTLDFLDSNFFAVFMSKEMHQFTVISNNMKSFALQIITKITGGNYITLLNNKKTLISRIIMKNIQQNNYFLGATLMNFSFSFSRLIPKKTRSNGRNKIIKLCPRCKSIIIINNNFWCERCGLFLLPQKNFFRDTDIFNYKYRSNIYPSFYSGLFLFISNGQKTNSNFQGTEVFNFHINEKKNGQTEFSIKNFLSEHNEVLVAELN